MSEVKKSINAIQMVGVIEECGNLVFDATATNKKNPKIKGAITTKDLKKPAFVINVNGYKIGVRAMPTYQKKANEEGKLEDNKNFAAMQKIMSYEVGTRVKINGSVNPNEYYSSNESLVHNDDISMFSMSATNVSGNDDYAEGLVSGIVYDIKQNEYDSTKLDVTLFVVQYDGSVVPMNFVVMDIDENDQTRENFESSVTKGDNIQVKFDIITSSNHSTDNESNGGYSRKKAKITRGFAKQELSIFGWDMISSDSDQFIDIEKFKVLLKEYKVKLEEKKKATRDKKNGITSKSGLGGLGNKMASTSRKQSQALFDEATEEGLPFDTDTNDVNLFGGSSDDDIDPFA
jgi:hypothetical protein